MNFSEKIRDTARDDSRRFAKGIFCKIIYQPIALRIMQTHKIIPSGIYLNAPSDTPYFDSRVGKFFVIPGTSFKQYIQWLNQYKEGHLTSVKGLTQEDMDNILEKEQDFADYLRQVLVLVTIPADRLAEKRIVDPRWYDVIVETLDVSQTADCIFVKGTAKYRFEEKEIDK